jgi:hypothetical protein
MLGQVALQPHEWCADWWVPVMKDNFPARPGVGNRTASRLNVVAGIWLILSPWTVGLSWPPVACADTLLVGIVVLIVAAIRLSTPHTTLLSWINFLLGMWLFLSPFLLSFWVVSSATANAMILGGLIGVLGLGAAQAPHSTAPSPR